MHLEKSALVPCKSPLRSYGLILGRRWSDLEFEDQAAVRLGLRQGILTLDADRRVQPKKNTVD